MVQNEIISTWVHIFDPLLKRCKYRYKIMYGGRGGAKTEHVGRALLIMGQEYRIRILCTREIQNSIDDSVYQTLVDLINLYDLNEYHITKKTIINTVTGTQFIFKGLSTQTINSLKSLANIDICWVEEAQAVTQDSWDILIPTIRKMNSEIWITFNPDEEDDATYTNFVMTTPPDSWIQKVTWRDNPYFPEVLRKEMEYAKKTNIDKYNHVWEGEPKKRSRSLIYRFNDTVNCIDKRIEYTAGCDTYAAWDFGVGDDTAIIFMHVIKLPTEDGTKGIRIMIFDEYSNSDQSAAHYREYVDNKGYRIDMHYCDPSGKNRDADLSSWVTKLAMNPKTKIVDWHMEYTHSNSVTEMVDNANDYMIYVRINKEQCPNVYKMFKKWGWRVDRYGKVILPPKTKHDEYSHFGTAFYYFTTNKFPIDVEGDEVTIVHQ